jgi:peptide/nickel transport system substrate-binding protein
MTPRGVRGAEEETVRSRTYLVKSIVALAIVATIVVLAACGSSSTNKSSSTSTTSKGTPKKGGSLTVLEDSAFAGAWPAGLDPATNTNGAANQPYMNSIYGQLFRLNEKGKVEPELVSKWAYANGGKTVKLTLRPGVKFSDGTPFDADAVAFNIKRDLKSTCTCRPTWPVKSVTTEGTGTVVLNFMRPFAAVIASFIDSNANWTASPTALKKLGEKKFRIKPVGAGPFKVVSNKLSSELVLERNPTYWKPGHPLLDNLTFKSIGGDEAAYQAMLAGQAQAYEGMSTPKLVQQAAKNDKLKVTQQLSTSPYFMQLNTTIPPFNNPKARQAIYYASNSEVIRSKIFNNLYENTQGFTGPGGLFFQATVPGYRTYDLEKAKALVKELGGLKIDLGTINVLVAKQTIQALQTQWAQAGIKATIHSYDLPGLIQAFQSKKWQAMLQTAGSFDPAQGVGVAFRMASQSPFSGIKDPKLDTMLNEAAGTLDQNRRKELYGQIAKYVSDQAYGPFYFAFAPANVALKGVSGPGLTTAMPAVVVNPDVFWDEVSSGGGA